MEGQPRRGERVDQAELRRVPGSLARVRLWTGVTRVFQVTTVSKLHATLVDRRKAWRRHLDAAWDPPALSSGVYPSSSSPSPPPPPEPPSSCA